MGQQAIARFFLGWGLFPTSQPNLFFLNPACFARFAALCTQQRYLAADRGPTATHAEIAWPTVPESRSNQAAAAVTMNSWSDTKTILAGNTKKGPEGETQKIIDETMRKKLYGVACSASALAVRIQQKLQARRCVC